MRYRTRNLQVICGVVAMLAFGLAGCGEDANEKPAEPAAETDMSAEAAAPSTVHYPEYERSKRVDRIGAVAADTDIGLVAFGTCAGCHGVDGLGSRTGEIPRLAGQVPEVLIEKLLEISEGVRHRPEMAQTLTMIDEDKEIASLAAHITALPDPEAVIFGAGDDLALGGAIYQQFCASCHEPDGYGNGEGRIPRIAGWDHPSIKRTLVRLGADTAEIHETGMSDLVSMMTEKEIDAVADYVARLGAKSPSP